MKSLIHIFDEVHTQCTTDKCQSRDNISLLCMKRAIEEYHSEIETMMISMEK